jgi:hypothetical protein
LSKPDPKHRNIIGGPWRCAIATTIVIRITASKAVLFQRPETAVHETLLTDRQIYRQTTGVLKKKS